MTEDIGEVIESLEDALEIQRTTEGEITSKPTVGYCFDCDEITVGKRRREECIEHHTVSSDGYEHGGIQSALTALRYRKQLIEGDEK